MSLANQRKCSLPVPRHQSMTSVNFSIVVAWFPEAYASFIACLMRSQVNRNLFVSCSLASYALSFSIAPSQDEPIILQQVFRAPFHFSAEDIPVDPVHVLPGDLLDLIQCEAFLLQRIKEKRHVSCIFDLE